MGFVNRVPLAEEPIDGQTTVANYDRYAALFMVPEYSLTIRKILKRGIKDGAVLDVGTGSGRLILAAAAKKPYDIELTGLDVSFGMLYQALINFKDLTVPVHVLQATAARMPFVDNTFEAVMSYASLHHWQQPETVFNEMWRVTKPGGLILVRDNRRMLGNPLYRVGIWTISLLMQKEQKKTWPKSILASYTINEVKQILARTNLRNYRVYSDMGGFDLCIEARKEG